MRDDKIVVEKNFAPKAQMLSAPKARMLSDQGGTTQLNQGKHFQAEVTQVTKIRVKQVLAYIKLLEMESSTPRSLLPSISTLLH